MTIRSKYKMMTALFLSSGVLMVVLATCLVSVFIWLPFLAVFAGLGAFIRCPACGYPIAHVPHDAELLLAPKRCSHCGRLTGCQTKPS
jgi:hypothetical protein